MKTSCEIVHYSAVLGGDTAPYPARFLMALKKSSNSGKERSPESSVSCAKQKASSTVSTTRASSASHAVTNQHGERIKLHALVQRGYLRRRLDEPGNTGASGYLCPRSRQNMQDETQRTRGTRGGQGRGRGSDQSVAVSPTMQPDCHPHIEHDGTHSCARTMWNTNAITWRSSSVSSTCCNEAPPAPHSKKTAVRSSTITTRRQSARGPYHMHMYTPMMRACGRTGHVSSASNSRTFQPPRRRQQRASPSTPCCWHESSVPPSSSRTNQPWCRHKYERVEGWVRATERQAVVPWLGAQRRQCTAAALRETMLH